MTGYLRMVRKVIFTYTRIQRSVGMEWEFCSKVRKGYTDLFLNMVLFKVLLGFFKRKFDSRAVFFDLIAQNELLIKRGIFADPYRILVKSPYRSLPNQFWSQVLTDFWIFLNKLLRRNFPYEVSFLIFIRVDVDILGQNLTLKVVSVAFQSVHTKAAATIGEMLNNIIIIKSLTLP